MKVICIDNKGCEDCFEKFGKIYDIYPDSGENNNFCYVEGVGSGWLIDRFMSLKEYRKLKLDQLNR